MFTPRWSVKVDSMISAACRALDVIDLPATEIAAAQIAAVSPWWVNERLLNGLNDPG
jgi:hypothetical protein